MKTFAEYLRRCPPAARKHVRAMRAAIRAAAPAASETISYAMPAFEQDGILVWYAGFADHASLFPKTGAIRAFAKQLARYAPSKGTIRFPLDKPIPAALVARIVKFRIAENARRKRPRPRARRKTR